MTIRPLSRRAPRRAPLVATTALGLGVGIGAAGLSGCTKLVNVDLSVNEPCGQENRVTSGVVSYRVLSSGADAINKNQVAFRADAPQGMSLGLGDDIIVTVEGYQDDILLGDPTAPTVAPFAIGRTMPLIVGEGSLDVKANVLVGLVDSFGGPRDLEGNCTQLSSGRHAHTATYIPGSNKVLIFGGATFDSAGGETLLKSAEVFDPLTGTFTALPEPAQARAYHTATALPDGRVLILGGFSILNSQVAPLINGLLVDVNAEPPYVGDVIMRTPRAHHTATLLEDIGVVAIIGGCTGGAGDGCTPTSASGNSTALLNTVELWSSNNTAQTTGVPNSAGLTTNRAMHQAVAFPSGNTGLIVVSGGLNSTGALRGVEYFQVSDDGLTNVFSQADALPAPVVRHQMLAFTNNTNYFILGGQNDAPGGVLSDAVAGTNTFTICDKTDNQANCRAGSAMLAPRFGHHAAVLRDGSVVAMGGAVVDGLPKAERLRFVAGSEPLWEPVATDLAVGRERGAMTLLGGLSSGSATYTNQIFYVGGHTTVQPYTSLTDADIYFGK